jgi:hypothetical protein
MLCHKVSIVAQFLGLDGTSCYSLINCLCDVSIHCYGGRVLRVLSLC